MRTSATPSTTTDPVDTNRAATVTRTSATEPRDSSRWVDRGLIAGIGVIAFALRAATAGHFQTIDEFTWMRRSAIFSAAVLHGDFGTASATHGHTATMPGITTMLLGSLTRLIWRTGDKLGFWHADGVFQYSALALHIAQLCVAATCALLVAAFVGLTFRWAGRVVGTTAGLLLATEPFMVAHGAVMHTDELTAFFGVAGLVAFLLLLDLPHRAGREPPAGRRKWMLAIATGLLLAGALLTKVSALEFVPGLVLLTAWAVWRRVRAGDRAGGGWQAARREVLLPILVIIATIVVTGFALWPALWIAPGYQLSQMLKSAKLADADHLTFFRGHVTGTPGAVFYAIALPFRMTPWFLIAVPISTVVALVARRVREYAVCILLVVVPMLVILSRATKQFDRYGMSVLPLVALLVGLGIDELVVRARDHGVSPRAALSVGVAAATVVTVFSFSVAPWGLGYFNPLLGGGKQAQKTLLVGWGEGLEQFGHIIARREKGHDCSNVYVVAPNPWENVALPCGRLVSFRDSYLDYAIVYVSERQRLLPSQRARVASVLRLMHPIAHFEKRGIDYGVLYARR
jgi:hypothetical protein